jgi:hypothetical protein
MTAEADAGTGRDVTHRISYEAQPYYQPHHNQEYPSWTSHRRTSSVWRASSVQPAAAATDATWWTLTSLMDLHHANIIVMKNHHHRHSVEALLRWEHPDNRQYEQRCAILLSKQQQPPPNIRCLPLTCKGLRCILSSSWTTLFRPRDAVPPHFMSSSRGHPGMQPLVRMLNRNPQGGPMHPQQRSPSPVGLRNKSHLGGCRLIKARKKS